MLPWLCCCQPAGVVTGMSTGLGITSAAAAWGPAGSSVQRETYQSGGLFWAGKSQPLSCWLGANGRPAGQLCFPPAALCSFFAPLGFLSPLSFRVPGLAAGRTDFLCVGLRLPRRLTFPSWEAGRAGGRRPARKTSGDVFSYFDSGNMVGFLFISRCQRKPDPNPLPLQSPAWHVCPDAASPFAGCPCRDLEQLPPACNISWACCAFQFNPFRAGLSPPLGTWPGGTQQRGQCPGHAPSLRAFQPGRALYVHRQSERPPSSRPEPHCSQPLRLFHCN